MRASRKNINSHHGSRAGQAFPQTATAAECPCLTGICRSVLGSEPDVYICWTEKQILQRVPPGEASWALVRICICGRGAGASRPPGFARLGFPTLRPRDGPAVDDVISLVEGDHWRQHMASQDVGDSAGRNSISGGRGYRGRDHVRLGWVVEICCEAQSLSSHRGGGRC